MNLAGQRAAIVDQLATLPGVVATPSWPAPAVAGSAWPVWQSAQWVTESLLRGTWIVFRVLPAGSQQTTAAEADAAVMALGAALWPIGQVQNAEAASVQVEPGGATLPALRFTLEI